MRDGAWTIGLLAGRAACRARRWLREADAGCGTVAKHTVFSSVTLFNFVLVAFFVDETNCVLFVVKIVVFMVIILRATCAGDQIDAQEGQDAATNEFSNAVCGR